MEDVNISKYRASVVRDGSKPASPGFVVSEGQDPVNPPGTNNYVPYSGATANVELGEYGVEAGFITLDTTPTNTPADQGTIFWDADDETVDIILNGYTMKIGEDLFYPVKNQTGSTIAKGTAVRFNGTVGNSGRLLIAPFIANGSVPSNRFMGVTAEEILNGEDGKVLYFGRIRGINTNAFNEGDILYASTTVAGGFQTAIPVAPNNIVLVAAVVTKSINQGTIFVRPTLASNLNTDEAVKITSVANLDLLQYQSGTGLWENKTLAQILGGTASQFVKGNGSLDSTSYQPLLTNPVTGTGAAGRVAYWNGSGTITSDAFFQWNDFSKRLGIGRTPTVSLDVEGAGFFSGTVTASSIIKSGGTSSQYLMADGSVSTLTNPVTGTGTTNYLPKFTGSTTIGNSNLINDASGNLGLGVAPSPGGLSGYVLFELGNGGASIYSGPNQNLSGANISWSGGTASYKISNFATLYNQQSGQHQWYNAPSGTAGNAISFTQAMTLDANGRLSLGGTTVTDNTLLNIQGSSATHNVGIILNKTNATAQVYGIINQGPLDIYNYTSSAYMLRITSSGNLLVGTTTDNGARLQVSGTATFSSSVTAGDLISTSYGTARIQIISTANNTNAALRFTAKDSGGTSKNSGLYYVAGTNTSNTFLSLSADDNNYQFNVLSSGNVGIGTSSPATRLMVQDSGNTFVGHFSGLNQTNGVAIGTNSLNVAVIQGYTRTFSATNNIALQTDGGNLLVGTTTDNGARLQVIGFSRFDRGTLQFTLNPSYAGGNVYSQLQSTGALALATGGDNNRLYIDTSGNVGIGTSSPSAPLHLVTPTGVNFQNAIRFEKAGGYGEVNLENYYTTGSNYGFGIDVAGTTMMVVNNLGNVGIGTSSPSYRLVVNSGTDGISAGVAGSTYGIRFDNGGTFSSGMSTIHGVDSTLVGSYQPIMLNGLDVRFGTSANERMRITSGGNVLIGTTNDSPSAGIGIKNYADGRIYCVSSSTANTTESYSMYSTGAANYRFYVGWGGTIYATSTSISGISDISLKTNIRDLDKGLQDILQLKPRRFDWKNGDGKDNIGFVAQEIESIFPELISEYKYNQFETKKSLKMGDLIPSLVKAIQELKQEIDTLKN